MDRAIVLWVFCFLAGVLKSQVEEKNDSLNPTAFQFQNESETLSFGSEGLVDFSTIGAWNTSAQLMRFWIGEPDVFRIPIMFYTGATNLPGSSDELNAATIYDLVNPVGGNLSLAFDFGSDPLWKSKSGQTMLQWNFFGSAKLIRGESLESGVVHTDYGYFFEAGFTFRTLAWSGSSPMDLGIAFLSFRYAFSGMDPSGLERYFDQRTMPQGVRFETGVFIKKRLNFKLSYFQALSGLELPTLDKSQWRVGLDYRLGKQ